MFDHFVLERVASRMWARLQHKCLPQLVRLARAVRQNSSPRQIAWATAVGVFLGLLPKLSIFVLVVLLILYRFRLNYAAGLFSGVIFSVLGLVFQGFLHRTGFLILTWEPLIPVWTWIYNLPVVPWSGFNHTEVMGAIAVGGYLCWPVYLLSNSLSERFQAPCSAWLREQRWAAWLLPSDPVIVGSDQ